MRRALTVFVRVVDGLSWAGALLGAALLVSVACAVFYEVVARYIFRSPTEWSLELTTYALVWCGFFGAAYALKRGRHVRVDLLLDRLPPPVQRGLELYTDLLALAFCLLLVGEGARFVYQSYITEAASVSPLRVPLFIPELAVPAGGALLALQLLTRILGRLGVVPPGQRR